MTLLEMSLSGGAIIAVAALCRLLLGERLPRRAYIALWDLAMLRLLVPFRLPSRLSCQGAVRAAVSAWTAPQNAAVTSGTQAASMAQTASAAQTAPLAQTTFVAPIARTVPVATPMPQATLAPRAVPVPQATPIAQATQAAQSGGFPLGTVLFALWLAVALVLALRFALLYARGLRAFAQSLPCGDEAVRAFLRRHRLRRPVQVRVSGKIASPLSYGIARPVILLPRAMDTRDTGALTYVLLHEWQHIRALDALRKLAAAACLCAHWMNPMVYVMFLLVSRDMELLCDERVVANQGRDARRAYARTLLNMEEQRQRLSPMASGFSMNAMEERIIAMTKFKKRGAASVLAAVMIVTGTGAALATSAPQDNQSAPVTAFAGTMDAGAAQNDDVVWWTAEEYAAYIEQQRVELAELVKTGAKAYTQTDGWFVWTQEKMDETMALYEDILAQIKRGVLVSKTVGGSTDVSLMQGLPDDTVYEAVTEDNYVAVGEALDDAAGQSAIDAVTVSPRDGGSVTAVAEAESSALAVGETLTIGQSAIASAAFSPADGGGELTLAEGDQLTLSPEDWQKYYAKYEPFGLSYDAVAKRLLYQGKIVRTFEDTYPVGEGTYAGTVVQFPDGEVDVYGVRDLSGDIVRSADGSFDPSGRLTGLREATPVEYAARTREMNAPSSMTLSQETWRAYYEPTYAPFGLQYDVRTGRLMYDGRVVRAFNDLIADGSGGMSGTSIQFDDGDIDVFGERDTRGELIGLSAVEPGTYDIQGSAATAASLLLQGHHADDCYTPSQIHHADDCYTPSQIHHADDCPALPQGHHADDCPLLWGTARATATPLPKSAQATADDLSQADGLTEADKQLIAALMTGDYRHITVSAFRDRMFAMTDTPRYRALFERLLASATLYTQKNSDEAAFLFDVLLPLTSSSWASMTYSAEEVSDIAYSGERARLEYTYTVNLLRPDVVMVKDYRDIVLGVQDAMRGILWNRTPEALQNEALMRGELDTFMADMFALMQTEEIALSIDYAYFPLPGGEGGALSMDEEETRYDRATAEDCRALLALMTPGFEDMSLAEFNAALLAWANEDYDRMERTNMEAGWDRFGLTAEELSFVSLTAQLSGMENGEYVQSVYTGHPAENPVYAESLPERITEEDGLAAWCGLYYQFEYSVADPQAVTVGERDRAVGGMIEAVRAYFADTDIECLLTMTDGDILAALRDIAAAHSTERVAIRVREDQVLFERLDERARRN